LVSSIHCTTMFRTTVFIFLFGVLGVSMVNAQVGVSAVPFLNIEPDARSSALGNTGVTRIGTAHAAFWNPALLGFQSEGMLGLSHSNWLPAFGNTYYHDHFSISNPIGNRGAIAGHFTYLNLGSQTATDAVGNERGRFGNYEMAAGLSYGYKINRNWSVGSGIRYIRSDIGSGQFSDGVRIKAGSTFSADFGVFWQGEPRIYSYHDGQLRWGFAVTNLGSGIRYMDDQNLTALPSGMRIGISYEMLPGDRQTHKLITSFDLNKSLARMEQKISGLDTSYVSISPIRAIWQGWNAVDVVDGGGMNSLSVLDQFTYSFGLEYWYQNMLAARIGYLYEHPLNGDREFFTIGTGIRYRQMGVDFSYLYAPKGNQPTANTLRLTVKLSLPPRPAPVVVTPPTIVEIPLAVIQETVTATPVVEVEIAPVFEVSIDAPFVRLTADSLSKVTVDGAMVNFDLISSEIKPDFDHVVDTLSSIMNRFVDATLEIRGHTDTTGTDWVNRMLAESRARAVWLELVRQGVEPNRVSVKYFSDRDPLASNASITGRMMNRRVNFALSADSLYASKQTILAGIDEELHFNVPGVLLRGRDLTFDMLNLVLNNDTEAKIAAMIKLLAEDETLLLYIGTRIDYRNGSRNFMDELEKARSEAIMALLVSSGVDINRLHVVRHGSKEWETHIKPYLNDRLAEETVITAGF